MTLLSLWPQYVIAMFLLVQFFRGVGRTAQYHGGKPSAVFIDIAYLFAGFYVLYAGRFWAPMGFAP